MDQRDKKKYCSRIILCILIAIVFFVFVKNNFNKYIAFYDEIYHAVINEDVVLLVDQDSLFNSVDWECASMYNEYSESYFKKNKIDSSYVYGMFVLNGGCYLVEDANKSEIESQSVTEIRFDDPWFRLRYIDKENMRNIYDELVIRTARIMYEKGSYEEAIWLLNEYSIKHSESYSLDKSLYYGILGASYLKLRDHKNALKYFISLEKILHSRGKYDGELYVETLNNIGTIYYGLGDYRKALIYMESAYKMQSDHSYNSNSSAVKLMNIGVVYEYVGDYDNAKSFYRKSYDVAYSKRSSIYDNSVLVSVLNMANLESKIGNYAGSLRLFELALNIYDKLQLNDEVYLAKIMLYYGAAYEYLNLDKAIDLYLRSLSLVENNKDASSLNISLYLALSEVYLKKNILTTSEKYIVKAGYHARYIELDSSLYLKYSNILNEIYYRSNNEKYSEVLDRDIVVYISDNNKYIDYSIRSYIEYNVYSRLSNNYFCKMFNYNDESASYLTLRYIYKALVAKYEILSKEAKGHSIDEHLKGIHELIERAYQVAMSSDLEVKEEQLIINILSLAKLPQFSYYVKKGDISVFDKTYGDYILDDVFFPYPVVSEKEVIDLKKYLRMKNTFMIEYFVIFDCMYVLSLGGSSFGLHKQEYRTEEISSVLYISESRDYKSYIGSAVSDFLLSDTLMRNNNFKESSTLVIVPDKLIANLSFSAFNVSTNTDYLPLVQTKSIVYTNSVYSFVNSLSRESISTDEILNISSSFKNSIPVFGGNNSYQEISAYEEIDQIYNIVANRKESLKSTSSYNIVYDPTVNEVKYLLELKDYDIIHIATHGYSKENMPFSSNLVFNNSNIFKPAKSLSFYDISNLDMNVDLLVMSSCSAARNILSYQHLESSISEMLHRRGVKSIIAPLWEIDDRSTIILMKYFYENLLGGKSLEESLSMAQIELSKMSRYTSNPLIWSSFILIRG